MVCQRIVDELIIMFTAAIWNVRFDVVLLLLEKLNPTGNNAHLTIIDGL